MTKQFYLQIQKVVENSAGRLSFQQAWSTINRSMQLVRQGERLSETKKQ